jgi:hypothetical protein
MPKQKPESAGVIQLNPIALRRDAWSDQPAQDLRGLKPQRRFEIGDARAFLFALAIPELRAAMPACARRDRLRAAGNVAARPVACQVDDVGRPHYDFLNHCFLATHASVIAESRRVNVQSNAQILPENFTGDFGNLARFFNLKEMPNRIGKTG